MELSEYRDPVALIFYCVAGFFAFLFIFLFTVVIGWTVPRLLRTSQRLLKENVQPTLDNVKQTSDRCSGDCPVCFG